MTAINIVALPDALHLFCDGVSYDAAGVVKAHCGKSRVLPSLSTVMMCSGRSIIVPYLAHLLEQNSEDFDDLRDNVADRLRQYQGELSELFGDDDHSPTGRESGFRLFFAGWSKRSNQPAAFSISNSTNDPAHPPYSVVDVGRGQMAPWLSSEEWAAVGGPPVVNASTIENVVRTTLELQRQQRWADGTYRVGGHVEHVVVRRDHIDIRILKRWDEDRIGEPLRPSPVDWEQWRRDYPVHVVPLQPAVSATVTTLQPSLNRQQRRAAARGNR